jgi:hypothetical protein
MVVFSKCPERWSCILLVASISVRHERYVELSSKEVYNSFGTLICTHTLCVGADSDYSVAGLPIVWILTCYSIR